MAKMSVLFLAGLLRYGFRFMLKQYLLKDGHLQECDDQPGNILVFVTPDDAERKLLLGTYKLDEHTLNSALDPDEVSRLEFEDDHVAMIFKRPKNYSSRDQYLFKVGSVGVFLFEERLIVLLSDDIQLFNGKLFNRVNSLLDLTLRVLYRTIQHYVEHLKVINMIADSLEQKISTAMENKYLLNLFTLEKSLVYYLSAINANASLIDRCKHNAVKLKMTEADVELLEDILIENNQCYRLADIYSTILGGMMDARVSIVNNNLNVLMKTLNIITIGIMVPTFVVSAFSMNVQHPLAFWAIAGMALASVVIFILIWRHKVGSRTVD
jgi:magnesium transporter